MSSPDLATLVATAKSGAVITLDPPGKEFQGPIRLTKPLTIQGQGGTIWAERGPVLIVESTGVVLEHLNIEVTGSDPNATGAEACALIATQAAPKMRRVAVKGQVHGIPGEQGEWRYPNILRLGRIQAGVPHTFIVRLVTPVPCQIESQVSGVTVSPLSLAAGTVEVTIAIEKMSEGIRLKGPLLVNTPGLTRRIELSAHLAATGAGVTVGTGQVIYEHADWARGAVPTSSTPIVVPTNLPTPTPPPAPPQAVPVANPVKSHVNTADMIVLTPEPESDPPITLIPVESAPITLKPIGPTPVPTAGPVPTAVPVPKPASVPKPVTPAPVPTPVAAAPVVPVTPPSDPLRSQSRYRTVNSPDSTGLFTQPPPDATPDSPTDPTPDSTPSSTEIDSTPKTADSKPAKKSGMRKVDGTGSAFG